MKRKPKIVFLGGRILGKLTLDLLAKYKDDIEVVTVIPHTDKGDSTSDWNPPILNHAKELGFPTSSPKKLGDNEFIQFITEHKPDVLLNAFCNRLIPKALLELFPLGSINFHYGKLPKYQGRFIVSHIINNNEKEAFVTAHFIEEKIDTGNIIFEKKVKVLSNDTAKTLYMRCTDASVIQFEKVLKYIINGKKLPSVSQEGESNYFPFEELNNCKVDLNWDKEKIERFIRAVTFPPISTPLVEINDLRFQINQKVEV